MFNNREMNPVKMILAVLLKWRVIVMVTLLFAIIVSTAKYVKDLGSDNMASKKATAEIDYTQDSSIYILVNFLGQYDRIKAQMTQAEGIGFDPEKMTYAYVQYYVKGDADNDSYVSLEGDSFGKTTFSDLLQYEISEANDFALLYKYYIQSEEFSNSILTESGSKADMDLFMSYIKVEAGGSNLVVKVPVCSDMNKDELLSQIKELITSKFEENNAIDRHSMRSISEGFCTEKNKAIIENRYKQLVELDSVKARIDALKKDMTAEQCRVAEEVYYGSSVDDNETEDKLIEEFSSKEVRFRPVFFVLGAILGALISVCWYCLIYVISGKLQTAKELTSNAKLLLFETLEVPTKSKNPFGKVDDLIRYYLHNNRRKLTKEQQIKAIVSSISLFAEQNDIKSVCISSSLYGKEDDAIMKEIVDAVSAEGIKVSFVDDIAYDKDALRASADSDGMILIEHIGQSFLAEIEKELVAAKEYNVRVLGAVVLE